MSLRWVFRLNGVVSCIFAVQLGFMAETFWGGMGVELSPAQRQISMYWGLAIQTFLGATQWMLGDLSAAEQIRFGRLHVLWWMVCAWMLIPIANTRGPMYFVNIAT